MEREGGEEHQAETHPIMEMEEEGRSWREGRALGDK